MTETAIPQLTRALALAALLAAAAPARADENRTKLSEEIRAHCINSWWESYMFEQLFTYKLSESCWKISKGMKRGGVELSD